MARRPDRAHRPRSFGFVRERGGNVAILFAFLSVPMLMFTGAAIDYGFATRVETKLQAATDGTALLLCQTPLTTSNTDLNTLAQTAMIGAMGAANLVVDPLVITSNPRQITLTAHKLSTVFFGKFTGTTRINPGSKAQCATPLPKTFEIALVLDNTGSMAESSGGQSKLQAVQTAATNFVSYVSTNAAFSSATRISIVPFAGAVAVDPSTYRYASWIDLNGQSSYHWTNVLSPSGSNFTSRFDIFTKLQRVNSNWSWAGCLETLPYPLNVQDGAPTSGNKDSLYVPLFAPDEPGDASSQIGTFPTDSNRPTAYSYNSYINDDTGGSCKNSSTFNTALGQACKYVTPTNPISSSYLGIPNGPNFGCTTQPLQRLTNSTSTLKTLISNMAPLGSTNIHEGFMWGWRTLSPNNVFKDDNQAAYASSTNSSNATTINKIIILMTDGANSWTANPNAPTGSLYFAAGYFQNANTQNTKTQTPNSRLPSTNQNIADANSARNALDALTAQACTNAKAVNISIYTIGFSIPSDPIDAAGQTLLQNCASSANQYFLANTSDDLISAFKKIQQSIGALRLTQ
ncbi:pilus assembly protein TadG-related protein [Methylobacterium sp. J-072]|uniref:TadE/TadG family type IV pilus assembly protein n=1 Tax=Methylobacterium sp. J-072 TaxID=2836651 RepID=UPI001FB9CB93|nr:TadE/TadG family type IV pilus assembly protein [Methylobacterium sp. J-072]MCJ2093153.1 pilus assembly protein TadG-related protein [Methylobacterium sp. J-072]